MSRQIPRDSEAGRIIDVGTTHPRRRRWKLFLLLALVLLFILSSKGLSIYLSALWFNSLGYGPVYWYMFRLKVELFLIFFVITTGILRGGLWLVERTFSSFSFDRRTIMVNQQPVNFSPE